MVQVTRPGGGITLNAGWPEVLLDANGEPMTFTDEDEARAFLLANGLTGDQIAICQFPEDT